MLIYENLFELQFTHFMNDEMKDYRKIFNERVFFNQTIHYQYIIIGQTESIKRRRLNNREENIIKLAKLRGKVNLGGNTMSARAYANDLVGFGIVWQF